MNEGKRNNKRGRMNKNEIKRRRNWFKVWIKKNEIKNQTWLHKNSK